MVEIYYLSIVSSFTVVFLSYFEPWVILTNSKLIKANRLWDILRHNFSFKDWNYGQIYLHHSDISCLFWAPNRVAKNVLFFASMENGEWWVFQNKVRCIINFRGRMCLQRRKISETFIFLEIAFYTSLWSFIALSCHVIQIKLFISSTFCKDKGGLRLSKNATKSQSKGSIYLII